MSRPIDADALIDKFKNTDANGINLYLDRYAIKCVEDAPTIEERKTGAWIDCNSSDHWKCSECGDRAPMYWDANRQEYDEWYSPYCPNCGARMDI